MIHHIKKLFQKKEQPETIQSDITSIDEDLSADLNRQAEKAARISRKRFIKNASELSRLIYNGPPQSKQPDPIIAACYYLGHPLPSDAGGSVQPSAYIESLDGSFEGLISLLGKEYLPDTPGMRKDYNTFRDKYESMHNIDINETDLAVFFTDYLFHCKDYGYRNIDYFNFEFFRRETADRRTFLSTLGYMKYTKKVCVHDMELFKHKGRFNSFFSDVVRRRWLDTSVCSFEDFLSYIKEVPSFFAKPVSGTGGDNTCIIDSASWNITDLWNYCRENDYIIEEVVRQHSSMSSFNSDSVNTIRVYVLVDINDQPHIMGAIARFGRAGVSVDNFHKGGTCAAVDIMSGEIITDAFDIYGTPFEFHPDSGVRYKGFVIPEWSKLCATISDTALKCRAYNRHVGWDVAITEDGAIEVIEGNSTPNFDILQAIDKTGKRAAYDEYMTPLAESMGIKPYSVKVPSIEVSGMQADYSSNV